MTAPSPHIYYLVTSHGALGLESVVDYDRCSRNDILRCLLTQDYMGRLVAVHCIDQSAGAWTDVSQEMARSIREEADAEIVGDLLDFVEAQLGAGRVAA